MYLKNFNLKNKTALVTGAGKGIGKACAIALAQAGANLIIISRTKKDLLGVQKKIISYKRKCTFFECDLFDIEKLDTVFKKIRKIDILVNNAGTNRPAHFTKIKREDMDYMIDLNLKIAFHVAQLSIKKMMVNKNRKSIGGSIINMSSQLGKVGAPNRSIYNMSKFLDFFTEGFFNRKI